MPDRIADPWGTRTPHASGTDWPVRVDQFLTVEEADVERWVHSTCILCSNGCGMDVAVAGGRMVGVRGQAFDRVNRGRLGPKGLFGWQANHSADRLTRPLVRRDGELVESDWDTALRLVADRMKALIEEMGPGSIGIYNTGQLFLEEYYTLSIVTKAGIGTPHQDGNTRLCTATADESLKESFACDGDPGSYSDIEHCDALFLVGHNVAETQTVLWARMLDRLDAPDRPRLIVVDPRRTKVAERADVHLRPRPGTNLALLNAIERELIHNGWVDHAWVDDHTVGFDRLAQIVGEYTPELAEQICDVPADDVREAARIIGTCERLVSTCLQGVYQSHQATASAVQVNNINLLRGMIGRPGAGILQMNGQPTAENTRECGANGDMPGFRNWQNDEHMEQLAALWNVDVMKIPHWQPPTHVMQQLRYIENGSIRFWWVVGTNPLVSLPELARVRKVLSQDRLFLVVNDAWLSETARIADVVLPAAIWGEKTGTFTNADRTVHLSEKAVEPPGEAKSDLEIFLELARHMDFRDRDGEPLVKWHDPESAFEAWKECSRGRPCDYTGITYERLRGGGIQWPCNDQHPDGTERLYTDGKFNSHPEEAEEFGRDLLTGAQDEEDDYRARNPAGRAMLKGAQYIEPHEHPDDDFPLWLTTGRTVYHWHTRTKTGRVRQLNDAAPEVWIEVSPVDAEALEVTEGDVVRVETRRGSVTGRARVADVKPGTLFLPFHYGYWDRSAGSEPDGDGRAANELTFTAWDPVSKQPLFKTAAARLARVESGNGRVSAAPTTGASAPVGASVAATAGGADAEASERVEEEA